MSQDRIDAIEYPPTHTYELKGLVPTGPLAERMTAIRSVAPDLFLGKYFLDVGANKGYFTMLAAQNCVFVEALEPDPACASLLKSIAPENVKVTEKTFGRFWTRRKFDRIFIGNGPHHLYREARGWGWIERLATLSNELVVLEGPRSMECKDLREVFPKYLRSNFNEDAFREAIKGKFIEEAVVPTTTYTPDRHITVLKRIYE